MTCEICGTRHRVASCAVCGIDMCHTCKAGRIGAEGCAITADDLCPEHYVQVRDYIESLKPRVGVAHDDNVFTIATKESGGPTTVKKLSDTEANALYEYMQRERRDS